MAKSDSCEPPLGHSRTDWKHCLAAKENELRGYQVETRSGPGGCPNLAIICKGQAEDIEQRLIKKFTPSSK